MAMTKEQHKRRHQALHANLDELFADFITHSGREKDYLRTTLGEFMNWSHQQTIDPNHKEDKHK